MHDAPPTVFASDFSADTLLILTGTDRAKLLHSFCTHDIKTLVAGQGREAFITNHQGKTIGHVIVQCHPDHLELRTVPGQGEKLSQHLNRFVITEDVAFEDATAQSSQWLLAGSDAKNFLAAHGCVIPAEMLGFTNLQIGEFQATCQLVPYAGNSFLLTFPRANLAEFETTLAAWNVPILENQELLAGLRIEGNWPLFGSDITDENLPQEIGRDAQTISFKKGCYLGQETVARLDALGHVNKILTRALLHLPTSQAATGDEILLDGKSVGRITSLGWSPQSSTPIAFVLLRVAHAKPGTRLPFNGGEIEILPSTVLH